MQMKLSKEEKKFRLEVCNAIEATSGQLLPSAEKKAIRTKPWASFFKKVRREVIECLCDFVTARAEPTLSLDDLDVIPEHPGVRAVWYLGTMFSPSANATKAGLDKHAERSSIEVFGFDVRSFKSVRLVLQCLILYLRDNEPLFSDKQMDTFVGANSSDVDHVALLVKVASPETLLIMHRLALLWRHLAEGNEAAMQSLSQGFASSVMRCPTAVTDFSLPLRRAALVKMITNVEAIFGTNYVGTGVRLGQGVHYKPRFLKENELEIMFEKSTLLKVGKFSVLVDEQQDNSDLFRVAKGELSVFVGITKVATLVAGDFFGESSLLSAFVSRARVVVESQAAEVRKLSVAHLNAVFTARPDLAATFYSCLAFEQALRLNVALIQYSRSELKNKMDISVNAAAGRHVIRAIESTRLRDESIETHFRYDADIHVVKAYVGKQIPKAASKAPREAIVYVFGTRIAVLSQKGHSQKKTQIDMDHMLKATATGADLLIEYTDARKKKARTVRVRLSSESVASSCVEVIDMMHSGLPGAAAPSEISLSTAVALFPFSPTGPDQIALVPGNHYTVLDRCGGWLYGFSPSNPDVKAFFPFAYCDLKPAGILVGGCMTAEDWKELETTDAVNMKRGEYVLKEGDATQAGHIFFVQSGSLVVVKELSDGKKSNVASLGAGEVVGDLLFLLGGFPRASVMVDSEAADVIRIDRGKLSSVLASDVRIASRFWKYLSCLLFARLVNLQLRLADKPPTIPAPVSIKVANPTAKVAAPVGSPKAPRPLEKNISFGIPVGMDPVAQAKLIEQLKTVLSDEEYESSEGDE